MCITDPSKYTASEVTGTIKGGVAIRLFKQIPKLPKDTRAENSLIGIVEGLATFALPHHRVYVSVHGGSHSHH